MWHGAHSNSAKGELSFIVMGYCQVGGGGGDWFTSVWLGEAKPSICQSCAAKWTIWRAAQQQACTRVSIWAEWEWRLMNTVQMWVEGVGKRNLSIWCFNYCGWPPAGYKILQALDQGLKLKLPGGHLLGTAFHYRPVEQLQLIQVFLKKLFFSVVV